MAAVAAIGAATIAKPAPAQDYFNSIQYAPQALYRAQLPESIDTRLKTISVSGTIDDSVQPNLPNDFKEFTPGSLEFDEIISGYLQTRTKSEELRRIPSFKTDIFYEFRESDDRLFGIIVSKTYPEHVHIFYRTIDSNSMTDSITAELYSVTHFNPQTGEIYIATHPFEITTIFPDRTEIILDYRGDGDYDIVFVDGSRDYRMKLLKFLRFAVPTPWVDIKDPGIELPKIEEQPRIRKPKAPAAKEDDLAI